MKKVFKIGALSLVIILLTISCKKKMSDADIQMKANTVVVNDPLASVEVKDGVAHLSGTFSTQKEKEAAISELKKVEGVKDLMDMASIETPVPMNENMNTVSPENMKKVNDVLKAYPGITSEVVKGELTIKGKANKEKSDKIKKSIDSLMVGKVKYDFTK